MGREREGGEERECVCEGERTERGMGRRKRKTHIAVR
jgi:hypothetical protein